MPTTPVQAFVGGGQGEVVVSNPLQGVAVVIPPAPAGGGWVQPYYVPGFAGIGVPPKVYLGDGCGVIDVPVPDAG